MKSDFLLAITQLSAEKNLPKEVVLGAVEAALVSAYRKEHFTPHQNISVKINPTTSKVEVWAEKMVVESPEDSRKEIALAAARKLKADAVLGDALMVEATPSNAGRIAAQTAKQVILQRLHEAESSAIFGEYADKEKDIVTGVVQRIEPRQIFINLGRAEALLPVVEQIPNERYRLGQRIKVCLIQIDKNAKGPKLVVSRSHPNLLRRLFELEIPEVYNGLVEIKSVAREAGYRSKVAVTARQEGIDPVGCCVGLRGIRIQNIVNELNGERIDVVAWNPDISVFIANALSPAQVSNVTIHNGIAQVVVPDRQLSLAIGKDGQNARLAAKLTGCRIDIKSTSIAAAEKAAEEAKPPEAVAVKEEAVAAKETEVMEPVAQEIAVSEKMEPVPAEATQESVEELAEISELEEEEVAAAEPVKLETTLEPLTAEEEEGLAEEEEVLSDELEELTLEPLPTLAKSQIRFAEDIFGDRFAKSTSRSRKKKKGSKGRGGDDEGLRQKKARQSTEVSIEEDEL
jgi:N utilization substance protein A